MCPNLCFHQHQTRLSTHALLVVAMFPYTGAPPPFPSVWQTPAPPRNTQFKHPFTQPQLAQPSTTSATSATPAIPNTNPPTPGSNPSNSALQVSPSSPAVNPTPARSLHPRSRHDPDAAARLRADWETSWASQSMPVSLNKHLLISIIFRRSSS